MLTSATLSASAEKERSASTSGAPVATSHPGGFQVPDGMRDLLLGSLHVAIGTQTNGVTEGHVMETTAGIVGVDGDAEGHGLARGEHGVAGQLAGKGDGVGIASLGALSRGTGLATFHVA